MRCGVGLRLEKRRLKGREWVKMGRFAGRVCGAVLGRVIVVALFMALLSNGLSMPVQADDPTTPQTPTTFAAHNAVVGQTDVGKTITLSFPLKAQDQAGLDALLRDLYDR